MLKQKTPPFPLPAIERASRNVILAVGSRTYSLCRSIDTRGRHVGNKMELRLKVRMKMQTMSGDDFKTYTTGRQV